MVGAGASSSTFWCRRWVEQSRSKRCRTVPWVSAMTWTSMCRPCSTYFSTRIVSSPNAEAASRLRGSDGLVVLVLCADDAHALAATAGGGLHEDREPASSPARHHRYAGGDRDLAGGVLAAHLLHHLGRWPDKGDPCGLERLGEGRPLGEEAVPGVDRLGTGSLGRGDDRVDVESRPAATQLEAFSSMRAACPSRAGQPRSPTPA